MRSPSDASKPAGQERQASTQWNQILKPTARPAKSRASPGQESADSFRLPMAGGIWQNDGPGAGHPTNESART